MKKLQLLAFSLLLSCISYAQTTLTDSIFCDGMYRTYRVYVPASYTGTTPRPLVFDLHGYTSNAQEQQAYSNFKPIADTANFLVVYPNGTVMSGEQFWNAGFGAGVDDIGFISDLIDSLDLQYNIDLNSVYSCGMSNGGYMSHTLACELSDRIAAVASVTGSMSILQRNTCNPNRAVPAMQIHGTADPTVSYSGSGTTLHIDTLVKHWYMNNNCNPAPVFTAVPNTNTTDGCTAEHYVWNGGDDGSSVELYKIIGGGHTWPGSPFIIGVTNKDFSASVEIWRFFRKYHLDQFLGTETKTLSPVTIYPNPAKDHVYIQSEKPVKTTLFDIHGKTVATPSGNDLDISSLSPGVYTVVFIADDNTTFQKLVKE